MKWEDGTPKSTNNAFSKMPSKIDLSQMAKSHNSSLSSSRRTAQGKINQYLSGQNKHLAAIDYGNQVIAHSRGGMPRS